MKARVLGLLVIFALLGSSAWAQFVPVPERAHHYVNDYAGVVNASDESRINDLASVLEEKTSAQLAVVTVTSTKPEEIQQYAIRLFDKWQIGARDKDNGVLILVAVKDRQAWIATGYGMEGAIPDATAAHVVRREMIPYFKRGQYSTGIREGASMIVTLMAREYGVVVTGEEDSVSEEVGSPGNPWTRILGVMVYIVLMLIFFSGRGGLLGWLWLGSTLPSRRREGYWHGGGITGGRGGFGGGFGGFGGGMSGGGGGGGGW